MYNFHDPLPWKTFSAFDAIYFCGGSPQYLLRQVREGDFAHDLQRFIAQGGVYVGVSAGSIIATIDLKHGLAFANCTMKVHVKAGDAAGPIDLAARPHIRLSNSQALVIEEGCAAIVE